MISNDNELIISQIMEILKKHPCDMAALRKLVTLYGSIERNKVFQEIFEIDINMQTTLSDFCNNIRSLAERPYRAS